MAGRSTAANLAFEDRLDGKVAGEILACDFHIAGAEHAPGFRDFRA